jgi:hypothetical protein
MKQIIAVLLTVCLLTTTGYAYGPRGHALVGAIADRRLAPNAAVAHRVTQLLDGLTLEQAANLPDTIKKWDLCQTHSDQSAVTTKKRINDELRAFVNANRCDSSPSHHDFHFTDVPVFGHERYPDGEVGRSLFDIVHMIPFCIRVLKGQEPEANVRAITKSVAVILLTHYLGDIHQPLHVGAEYFDASLKPFEPTNANKGFADQGGNKLTLFTLVGGHEVSAKKFHSYWDGQAVENAFGNVPDSTVAQKLAKNEPANWKLTGGVETWTEQLADEIMPVSREAHARLDFKDIQAHAGDKDISSGKAEERTQHGGTFYAIWAGSIVKPEIHKAGWRLAALLEAALQ